MAIYGEHRNLIGWTLVLMLWGTTTNALTCSVLPPDLKPGTYDIPLGGTLSVSSPRQSRDVRNYPPNQDCKWTLKAPDSKHVLKVTVREMDIEEGDWRCQHDGLFVYEGSGVDYSRRLYTLCGIDRPPFLFYSSTNVITLRFTSDRSKEYKGFSINITVVPSSDTLAQACGSNKPAQLQVNRDKNVTIYSPGYQEGFSFAPGSNCSWLLHTDMLNVISITLEELELGCNHVSDDLTCNTVVLYDGHDTSLSPVLQNYTGRDLLPDKEYRTTLTGGSYVTITLNAYRLVGHKRKFRLRVDSKRTLDLACRDGVKLTQVMNTNIQGPTQPGTYSCSWQIEAPEGMVVFITINGQPMDSSHQNSIPPTQCKGEQVVQIYDGNSTSCVLIKRVNTTNTCNPVAQEKTGPLSRHVLVLLHATIVNEPMSFTALIQQSAAKDFACSSDRQPLILHAPFGDILVTQGDSVLCTWRIMAPVDNVIELTLEDEALNCGIGGSLQIAEYPTERFDDGGLQLAQLCPPGIDTYSLLTSSVSFVQIIARFQHANRVKISYRFLSTTAKACQPYDAAPVVSYPLGGFSSLGYGFKNSLPSNYRCQCKWWITAPDTEHIIQMNFISMDLPKPTSSGECTSAWVRIYENLKTPSNFHTYCGTEKNVPSLIKANSTSVVVEFSSSERPNYLSGGFRLRYSIKTLVGSTDAACGVRRPAVMNSPQGIVESPGYPRGYPPGSNCHWSIRAPSGKAISLSFSDFDLEYNYGCTLDFLRITESNENAAVRTIGRFCGSIRPGGILATSNWVDLYFVSDGSQQEKGFKLSYQFVDIAEIACKVETRPAKMMTSAGTVTSPGYSQGQYPSGAYCQWLFNGTIDEVVELIFTNFRLSEQYRECDPATDSVTLYNGESTDSLTWLGRYCGYERPPTTVSGANALTLLFSSNEEIQGQGFQASYQLRNKTAEACLQPGKFSTSTPGIITSPGFGRGHYPPNSHCKWIITAPEGQVVSFVFEFLQIEPDPRCQYDWLDLFGKNCEGLQKRMCHGTTPDQRYYSSSNELCLRFISDSNNNYLGFKLIYHFEDPPGPGRTKTILAAVFSTLCIILAVTIVVVCIVKHRTIIERVSTHSRRRRRPHNNRRRRPSRTVATTTASLDLSAPPPYEATFDHVYYNQGTEGIDILGLPPPYHENYPPKPPDYSSLYPQAENIMNAHETATAVQHDARAEVSGTGGLTARTKEDADIPRNPSVVGNAAVTGSAGPYFGYRTSSLDESSHSRRSTYPPPSIPRDGHNQQISCSPRRNQGTETRPDSPSGDPTQTSSQIRCGIFPTPHDPAGGLRLHRTNDSTTTFDQSSPPGALPSSNPVPHRRSQVPGHDVIRLQEPTRDIREVEV